MKKVLVLAGSPRKGGNSDLLCDALIRGARESGNNAEKIYVQDLKIGSCRACYGCRGTGRCVQKDDMDTLLEKMIAAEFPLEQLGEALALQESGTKNGKILIRIGGGASK